MVGGQTGMIKLNFRDGLPFTEVVLKHKTIVSSITNVLIDTGSVSTIIFTELAAMFGLKPELDDKLHAICGVGGTEYVYEKLIDVIELDQSVASEIKIQIGAMDYGFDINMIIGMDFLTKVNAIVDLGRMTLTAAI
jgi:predicted aspartyl protease